MLTILVPTFNREPFLERLFISLDQQTDDNFKLLIMDDGSSDHTSDLIKRWKSKLDIEYHYHDNVGKPRTLIRAMDYLNSEYVFLLDSDAVLKDNAVATINYDISQYDNNEKFGGLFYCMEYPNGDIIGKKFNHPDVYTNFQKALDFDAHGDKAVIIRVNYLKQVEMPIFENEKFITESVFMNRVSLLCACVCKNQSIMITDYQDDGLTANIKNFWQLYPKGYHLFFLERINNHPLPVKKYLSSVIALVVFAFRSKIGYINTWRMVKGLKNKVSYLLVTPISLFCVLLHLM